MSFLAAALARGQRNDRSILSERRLARDSAGAGPKAESSEREPDRCPKRRHRRVGRTRARTQIRHDSPAHRRSRTQSRFLALPTSGRGDGSVTSSGSVPRVSLSRDPLNRCSTPRRRYSGYADDSAIQPIERQMRLFGLRTGQEDRRRPARSFKRQIFVPRVQSYRSTIRKPAWSGISTMGPRRSCSSRRDGCFHRGS
jgi:hypothetical protein